MVDGMVMMEESKNYSGWTAAGTSGGGACPFHTMDWWSAATQWQDELFALLALMAAAVYLGMYRWAQRGMHGPGYWPIVGSVIPIMKNWDRFHDFMLDFFDKGHDAVWLNFAFNEVRGLYFVDVKSVEHVMKTNFDNYPKGPHVTIYLEEILGKGIFACDYDSWKAQRKVASHEFSSSILRDLSTGVYKDHAVKLLRVISHYAESNQSMDFQDLAMRMTLDATCKLGFGVDLGCLSESMPEIAFAKSFDRANELSFHRYIDPMWKLKRKLNILEERELSDCIKVLDSFSFDVIQRRRNDMQNAPASRAKVKARPDLLSRFMSVTTPSGELYSDKQLRDVILNFIIAGRDTTGITLSWLMYRLCIDPSIEEKILKEIKALEPQEVQSEGEGFSDPYERFASVLTFQSLGKLHYLHAVLSETLRLYPPVPMEGKTATADDVLPNGARVEKGVMTTFSSYCMGRMERIWGPDAKEFRPERWLRDGVFQPESPYKFVSFHGGPRACLGRESAYLQMKATAALLVRFFKFQLVPDQNVTYRVMFVLTMSKGIRVTVSLR